MTVLGMNLRNFIIAKNNPRKSIRLVNDKYRTKVTLAEADVPVPGTIALVQSLEDLANLKWDDLPDAWALKPNRGMRGEGIMLATTRDGENWRTASGRLLERNEIKFHIERILDAEFSLEGLDHDAAMIEPLIIPHPLLKEVVPEGLPDTRIICLGEEPLMAMMRVPTRDSDGKANLHQGAIGAAIELDTGIIFRAVLGDEPITHHPDTDYQLIGLQVPHWDEVLAAATRCSEALRLGYVGTDIVVDAERGPLVLECNAFPGLAIQNVNARGLKGQIDRLGREMASFWLRHARKARPHSHVVTKSNFDRTLGLHPLHLGKTAQEAVETITSSGESVRIPNLRFASANLPSGIAQELADRVRLALMEGQWDDRGTGEAGALVATTRTDPPIALIGQIERDMEGRPTFRVAHASALDPPVGLDREAHRPLVLVCDDDISLTELLEIELEEAGYQVAVANNGREALRLTYELLPAAIVLDREMPEFSGTEVARRIRAHRAAKHIPIIMLTSLSRADQVVEGLGAGASDYVVKPFVAEELIARLTRVVPISTPPNPSDTPARARTAREQFPDSPERRALAKSDPSILCALGLHKPRRKATSNQGVLFSQCKRCGIDLIRRPGEEWRRVPKGMRVVWRPVEDVETEGADTAPD